MHIRKGPYGHYAIERADITSGIYKYAEQMINSDFMKGLLSVYTDERSGTLEMAFDFSGMMSIDEFISLSDHKKHPGRHLLKRRDSVRAFLTMLSDMTDVLLFPCSVCRDTAFIFTDPQGETIRFCSFPLQYEPADMSLSAIGEDGIEELLVHPFFAEVLTRDEIQQIIYCVSSGNNRMLREFCDSMENGNWKRTLRHKAGSSEISLPSSETVFGLMCASASLYASVLKLIPVSVLFFMAAVTFIYMSVRGSRLTLPRSASDKGTQPGRIRTQEEINLAKGRREALFDYERDDNGHVKASTGSPLILRGRSPDSNEIKYAMYSERIIIGSDRFLSDLFIDTEDVAAIHAEISKQDGTYYVRPLSASRHTYLENRRLEVEHDYELKSGQKLTLGETELELKVGFGA